MNLRLPSVGHAALATAVLFTAFAIVLLGSVPAANAASGQPKCSKFSKKIKKAKTGAKKRAAKRQLKQCKADTLVRNKIGNSHFVGLRSDGIDFDTIYCRDGAVQDSPGLGGEVTKSGWRVEFARVKSPQNFTAIMYLPYPDGGAFVQSVGFKNGQWQVGYESGDSAEALGDAVRTDATKECNAF